MGAPVIDGRRARELRAELINSAAAVVPEWTAANNTGDFGAALYEIAARLAEQSTRRLDKTRERDRLAFYEMLDLTGGAPRAATVPIAFTLSEKREERVDVPAAIQITAQVDDKTVPFETQETLQISPARIGTIIVADRDSDRLEVSPAGVHGGTPRLAESPAYRTASASVAGSRQLQFTATVGLQAKDVLRLDSVTDRTAHEVSAVKGDIVTLANPLEVFVGANARFTKVEDLEAFELRDIQEHCLFVGHKELLKLDAPATITLSLEPSGLASKLAMMDVSFALWGTKEGEEEPAWHSLGVGSSAGGRLRLIKSWPGSVEELEINGRKSRWLRARLDEPISLSTPATQTELVALRVASQPDPEAEDRTVTAAYHNALPLSLPGPFLPFGPEPQRFDTFAIAAPEALSKKDAVARLEIDLADAFPRAMSVVSGRKSRAYAIGADGRLHALNFENEKLVWHRIEDQPESASAAGTPNVLTLSDTLPIYAFAAGDSDLVIAADRQGQICINILNPKGDRPASGGWARLPAPDGSELPPWKDFTVIQTTTPSTALAHVVAASSTGIHSWEINANDPKATKAWTTLDSAGTSGIDLAQSATLAPGVGNGWPTDARATVAAIAAVDSGGTLYRGLLDFTAKRVAWRNSGKATNKTRPFLIEDAGKHLLAAASPEQQLFAVHVPKSNGQALRDHPTPGIKVIETSVLMGSCGLDKDNPSDVAVAAWEAGGLALWVPDGAAAHIDLPATGLEPNFRSGLLVPAAEESILILLAGKPETLFTKKLPEVRADTVVLQDWVNGTSSAEAVAVGPMPSKVIDIQPSTLTDRGGTYLALAESGLSDESDFRLCTSVSGALSGVLSGGELELNSADPTTASGCVIIGNHLHDVTNLDSANRKCAFTPATDEPDGPITYRWAEAEAAKQATDEQIGTLLRWTLPAEHAATVREIFFDTDAEPQPQSILAQRQAGNEIWLLLDSWNSPPPTNVEAALVFGEESVSSYSFPRRYENPELAWEYFDGTAWRHLEVEDGTANLARGGNVWFAVPTDLSPTDVAGKTELWVRARLIGGDYGRPKYVVSIEGAAPKTTQTIEVDTSDLHPPEIRTIKARYRLRQDAAPQFVLAQNNRATLDETQASLRGGARFALFTGIAAHTAAAAAEGDEKGSGRAIYVRMSKAPDVDVLNIFVDAVERDAPGAKLSVEVLTLARWAPISGFLDQTSGLLRPGMLRLPLSPAPAKMPLFGETGWWFRLRVADPGWAPIVRGVYLNAAKAIQAQTLDQEVVGSSTGEPNQRFSLVQSPVIPDSLELRVRETLSDEERAEITAQFGDLAIKSYLPEIAGDWVLWSPIGSFAGSAPEARVYRLDPSRGELLFGNNRRGKIPPVGRDGIRAISYRSGGGQIGNVAPDTVKNVRSAIQSLDSATNPTPATGGADLPDVGASVPPATAQLRHAGHSLTPADVEAFALASSPDVVKARWLSGSGHGFSLVVSIREEKIRKPQMSRARREGLAEALAEWGWGVIAPGTIDVRTPAFRRATIEATVIAASADRLAAVELASHRALLDLLDPALGPRGTGAEFGTLLRESDVQRALGRIDGLDRVDDLKIAYPGTASEPVSTDTLVYGEEEDVVVTAKVEPRQ